MTEKTNRLTETEREVARRIFENARQLMAKAAKKDYLLLWALRRYVYTRLIYDERGTPMQRRSLKKKKMVSQRGLCAICKRRLPKKGAELDRRTAVNGYTEKNTRLVHHKMPSAEPGREGLRLGVTRLANGGPSLVSLSGLATFIRPQIL